MKNNESNNSANNESRTGTIGSENKETSNEELNENNLNSNNNNCDDSSSSEEEESEDEISKLTWKDVIQSQTGYDLLMNFLGKELSTENLLFITEVC